MCKLRTKYRPTFYNFSDYFFQNFVTKANNIFISLRVLKIRESQIPKCVLSLTCKAPHIVVLISFLNKKTVNYKLNAQCHHKTSA